MERSLCDERLVGMRIPRALLLVAGLALTACSQPTPIPTRTVAASTAVSVATPAPSPTTVALRVFARMLEQCGSEGGCAYYAELRDSEGRVSTEDLGYGSEDTTGFPERVPPGRYTLTVRSVLVSDVIVNGEPPDETADVACTTTFEAVSGLERITAIGSFRADSCEIVITVS